MHSLRRERERDQLFVLWFWLLGQIYDRNGSFWFSKCTHIDMGFCIQSNPENTVGVLTMAGKGVRVLVTPTSDLGKILACMHGN